MSSSEKKICLSKSIRKDDMQIRETDYKSIREKVEPEDHDDNFSSDFAEDTVKFASEDSVQFTKATGHLMETRKRQILIPPSPTNVIQLGNLRELNQKDDKVELRPVVGLDIEKNKASTSSTAGEFPASEGHPPPVDTLVDTTAVSAARPAGQPQLRPVVGLDIEKNKASTSSTADEFPASEGHPPPVDTLVDTTAALAARPAGEPQLRPGVGLYIEKNKASTSLTAGEFPASEGHPTPVDTLVDTTAALAARPAGEPQETPTQRPEEPPVEQHEHDLHVIFNAGAQEIQPGSMLCVFTTFPGLDIPVVSQHATLRPLLLRVGELVTVPSLPVGSLPAVTSIDENAEDEDESDDTMWSGYDSNSHDLETDDDQEKHFEAD